MGLLNLDKIAGNPLIQAGLGILANNTGNYGQFAPAFGKGTQQGLLSAQTFNQNNQDELYRKQQMDLLRQKFGQDQEEFQLKKNESEATQKAIDEFDLAHPEYKGMARLPAAAFKAVAPNSGVDPYYTPIATENGLGSYNNRTGGFEALNIQGRPIIKSTDSPLIRGAVKGAEAKAGADWKLNTNIDGKVYTDAQVSNMATGSGGVSVPTATEKKQAEANIDVQKQLTIDTNKLSVNDTDANKGRVDAMDALTDAKNLLSEGIYTGTYANIKLKASKLNPLDNPKKAENTEAFVAAIGNTVVPRLKEFGGNDSVEEMNYLKAIMGGNITLEEGALKKILDSTERKIKRGMDRANKGLDANGAEMPNNQKKSAIKGQVYKGHKFLGGDPSNPANWKKE